MTDLTRAILAIFAVIIISLALSTSKIGARFVQGVLIIAIVAVVLMNEPRFRGNFQSLASTILQTPTKPTDTRGD
jgi:hypothetical protein